MNRIIKYRGKRIDNGEWVYGYYNYCSLGGKHIIAINNDYEEDRVYYSYQKEAMFYEVIPETVGQYIGLDDKNNREIYEGDITRVYGGEYCQGYYEYDNKCIVKWQTCGFDMVVIKEGYGIGLGFCDNSDYIVILGNIHDNPELLGHEMADLGTCECSISE